MSAALSATLVGEMRIAYEPTGKGPALLLLYGGGSDHREWRRQLGTLCDEFTVVAWDAPWCGQSSHPPESFRLPAYADCLAGFIAALCLERPHVVGQSFGGGLALELYRRHPALPRSLTLASAYAGWAGSLPAGRRTAVAASPARGRSATRSVGSRLAARTVERIRARRRRR